ncbi:MAG: peptide chain release factor 2 [Acidobacteriota bacterium]
MLEELKRGFQELRVRIQDIRSYLDSEAKKRELKTIEEKISDPNFWADQSQSQKVLQRRKVLEAEIGLDQRLSRAVQDLEAFFELGEEGEDVVADIKQEMEKLEKELDAVETETLLSGQNAQCNAFLAIHPGAGGTESQDWAEMLLRMYLRWAEQREFTTETIDYQVGEEAGIKSATVAVKGPNAYGLLSAEIGVHRLVRISPYDANKRRHTSFASVFVYPEIDENIEIKIEEKDLRIDTYRSTGAGGQHINTTDSAVRITHLPTGIVVSCQNERSQHKNRSTAFKILRSRLYELEMEKKRAESKAIEDAKMDIAWGSQIRSYVLHPYRLAKDHRTKLEIGDVDRVLDGDLDPFIKAYLVSRRDGKQKGREAGMVLEEANEAEV